MPALDVRIETSGEPQPNRSEFELENIEPEQSTMRAVP
jgi:hypothetical protein